MKDLLIMCVLKKYLKAAQPWLPNLDLNPHHALDFEDSIIKNSYTIVGFDCHGTKFFDFVKTMKVY